MTTKLNKKKKLKRVWLLRALIEIVRIILKYQELVANREV